MAAAAGTGQRFLGGEQGRAFADLDLAGRILAGALDLEVEVDLAAEAQRHRIHRRQVGGVPVGVLAHRFDGRLGGAHEAHDLRVLELGMVANQPADGVRALVAARDGGVARTLALGDRDPDLGLADLHAVVRVGLGLLDFLAGELAVLHGIDAHDAAGDVAVGNALNFERVKGAEGSDLVERERGVVHEPDGSGLGHEQGLGHGENSPGGAAGFPPGRSASWPNAEGNWLEYTGPPADPQWLCRSAAAPNAVISTSLPRCVRVSMAAWARAASASG